MRIDNCHTISTAILKKYGYLQQGIQKQGSIIWYRDNEKTNAISVSSNTKNENDSYIILNYSTNGESIEYKIPIQFMPSNLGKGSVPFLICQRTNKRCRKLYRKGKYFLHREAYIRPMYESQLEPKFYRGLVMTYEYEKALEQVNSKHFKRSYNGRMTKRYKKLYQLMHKYENESAEKIEAIISGLHNYFS